MNQQNIIINEGGMPVILASFQNLKKAYLTES